MKKKILILALLLFTGLVIGGPALSVSPGEEEFVKKTFKTGSREVSVVTKEEDTYILGAGKEQFEIELDSYSITTRDSKTNGDVETKKYYLMDFEAVLGAIEEPKQLNNS